MEKTLRRALDSIVAQTYTNYEVIMVDDGSADRSGKICDEYASKYDKFRVVHKPNGGQSSARNTGIAESRATWVTFCDSDDFVYPEWLANFRLQEGNGHDLLTQGMRADKPHFGHKELQKESGFDFEGNPIDFLDMAYKHSLVGYTVIKAYKKKIIQDNGLQFDQRLWLREDDVFLLEYLSHCKKIKSYKEAGYHYFIPDWHKKYKISHEYSLNLEERIFQSLLNIDKRMLKTPFSHHNRLGINAALTNLFFNTCQIKYLRKLRNYYIEYADFANMANPSKVILRKDPTFLVSAPIIYIHMLLRKLLRKSINK